MKLALSVKSIVIGHCLSNKSRQSSAFAGRVDHFQQVHGLWLTILISRRRWAVGGFRWLLYHDKLAFMDDQKSDDGQRRDKLLLRVLKTPPQPRPKRERASPQHGTKANKSPSRK